jgi:hypothetical protein
MNWIIIGRVSDTDWIRIQEDQKMKNCMDHKVHTISRVPQCCLSPRPNWDPLFRKRVCPLPEPKEGGHIRLRVRGWGVPIQKTGEKACSTLSTLWYEYAHWEKVLGRIFFTLVFLTT